MIGLATVGVVVIGALIPLMGVYRVAVYTVGEGHAVRAAIATACVLPLQSWLLLSASRGRSSAAHRWALAAMAAAIIGMLPFIGTDWLNALFPLSALVLLLVPRPLSVVIFAGLVAVPAPMAFALGQPQWAVYFAVGTLMYGTAVAVPVWLIAAVRQLRAARLTLAQEAVVRERLRIDAELRRALGPALETIAARGDRASGQALGDTSAATQELTGLVDGARQTLLETRRLVRRFQAVSLRTELQTAVALLGAAGIQASIVLPPGDFPDLVDEARRRALRAGIARLLRDEGVRRCVCVVTYTGGRIGVELRHDGATAALVDVTSP